MKKAFLSDMDEKWIDVVGYEDIYEVSNSGFIRTHENKTTFTQRHGERKWKQRVLKFKGVTPKTGYRISLWKDGKQKDFLVSRLVAFSFFGGDISDRWLTVNHKDGNRMNNVIDNLELISLKENIRHGFESGLYSNQTKTILKNRENGEVIEFVSMSKASIYLGKTVGFISGLNKKGKEKYKNFDFYIE